MANLPIIDIHAHALPANAQGPPPLGFQLGQASRIVHDPQLSWPETFGAWFKQPGEGKVWSPESDEELRDQSIAVFEKRNIFAVTSGAIELVEDWRSAAPDRIIPAVTLNVGQPAFDPADLRDMYTEGRIAMLGEVVNQYSGIEPDDERFDPYLAVAEEHDIPVLIHVGPGPPGSPYLGFPDYRARLHSPLLLEEPLIRHPSLRLCVAHAGWPMLDNILALLWAHPRVYVDVGIICYGIPRAEFQRYLRILVEAGFVDRVLFGSDSMVWPGAVEPAIASIEEADFLTDAQKRAILYENAVRFLRFSDDEIASHHAAGGS